MFHDIERLFGHLTRGLEGRTGAGPVYYGYTMTIGPDGRPIIREYGNTGLAGCGCDMTEGGTAAHGNLLVDSIVDEKEDAVRLVAEMPGVEKSDIKVVVEDDHVAISARRGEKEYHAKVPTNDVLDRDSAKATYKNGILEVAFTRLKPASAGKTLEVN